VLYDTQADQYWYRPLFYSGGVGETNYDILSHGVRLMNKDEALVDRRWGEWYVAQQNDIDALLKNDPLEFINFETSDYSISYDFDRFYHKPKAEHKDLAGYMFLSVPDPEHYEMYIEEDLVDRMPDPRLTIGYTSRDRIDGGIGAGSIGIWATARGTKAAVPEPSMVLYLLLSIAGGAVAIFKKR
ncbi:hypothetical protein QA601_17590, partial [Chitinispirillales bacterium ANBcel5]|uniref:hypothetical protein n=1 Tax=Cellulosispirillum alkaliphilum TaxID=3039283 RepID=UPI002A5317A2|nr:hypothetical protein [Chitinispirillales bacterium ANBcel5]